jgi:glycosyltransferase involved in cell wall biosynthesis
MHRRGVARYLRCLLEELGALEQEDEYLVLVAGGLDAEPFRAPNVTMVRSRVPGRVLFGAAALTGRPRLDRLVGGCDVAWAPAPAPLAVSPGVPLVLTLHDMSFERATDYGRYERLWHRLARPERLARRATRVICPSGPVREAAMERWELPPERVRVVHSGAGKPREGAGTGAADAGESPDAADAAGAATGADAADAAGESPSAADAAGAATGESPGGSGAVPAGVAPPYVLAVGALEPRKLPGVLVEAHRIARSRGLHAGLVFAGDGPLRATLERSHATVLGHVPEPVLEELYAGALALACVSRDEGFGFTPVEALSRGTPPVIADLPVFAETLGEGALRVQPGDAGALAEALLRLERDPALRQRLVAAGREAVAHLSWERAAGETRAVLAEAAAA